MTLAGIVPSTPAEWADVPAWGLAVAVIVFVGVLVWEARKP